MNNEDLFEPIVTERLSLRCPRYADGAVVAKLVTPHISRWLASWPAPMTEQEALTKIFNARREIATDQALHFLIERSEDALVMGWMRVSRSEICASVGDLGYWLNEAYQQNGYAAEATLSAVSVAFERLNLDSIESGAQVENIASFAVMRRLGMKPCDKRMVWASARSRNELCLFYSIKRHQFL